MKPLAPKTTAEVFSCSAMLKEERTSVAAGRGRAAEGPWLGLALSGGGIRSATYCLGALQQLASARLLKNFDYISSVSGGGYTASSVQWWWIRDPQYDTSSKFPYGDEHVSPPGRENDNLTFLRWHSSYLAPGGGISIWSGIAVVLRTLILSLFVWLPISVGVALLLFVVGAPKAFFLSIVESWTTRDWRLPNSLAWHSTIPYLDFRVPTFAFLALIAAIALILVFLAFTAFLALASILVPPETTDNRRERIVRAAKCAAIGLVTAPIGYYGSSQLFEYGMIGPISAAVLIVAELLTAFGIAAFAVALLQLTKKLEFGVNYSLRRAFDLNATYGFASLLPLLTIASLPFASWAVSLIVAQGAGKGAAVGLLTTVSGVASALYGHFVQAQRIAPGYATRWAATIAAGAFIYLMILASYTAADFMLDSASYGNPVLGVHMWEIFPAVLLFSIFFGWNSNLNYLGLHRFYRDRLMEAFLPSAPGGTVNAPNYSDADRVSLVKFWDRSKPTDRPYPLINTNAIMINDDDPRLSLRGGDSFILSPLFVGSESTGWADTQNHIDRHGPITLASAMAASGAAANANAAYIGSGITRDRLISIVMMLLNVRLGLWLGKPGATSGTPNYFSPGFIYGVLRDGYKSKSNFVELTDGGHFDNLGVYELIRRRADVICALDSEEDPATALSALASVCARVQEDFGVSIEIGNRADKVVPSGDMGYPSGAKFTDKAFFIAKIEYPAPEVPLSKDDTEAKTGVFMYVKSNMLKEMSFPVKGYKAKNPEFPNQSTMDQFFEPAQFEAYRELGYSTMRSLITSVGLKDAGARQMKDLLLKAV